MGRREQKKDLTRRQILDAAYVLLSEKGYDNTAIEDITERANLAKGTFYYHFDSKEAIVIALRRDAFADTYQRGSQALAQGIPPLTVMENILLERAAWTEKNPDLAKVFYGTRIQHFLFRERPPDAPPIAASFVQLMYELVCAAQNSGALRNDMEPSELVQIIISCQLHAQGSWLGGPRTDSLVDKLRRWLHAILDGLTHGGQTVAPSLSIDCGPSTNSGDLNSKLG